jgi:hypothetical protein
MTSQVTCREHDASDDGRASPLLNPGTSPVSNSYRLSILGKVQIAKPTDQRGFVLPNLGVTAGRGSLVKIKYTISPFSQLFKFFKFGIYLWLSASYLSRCYF